MLLPSTSSSSSVPTGDRGRQEEGRAGRYRRDDATETPHSRAVGGQAEDGERELHRNGGSLQAVRGERQL